MRNLIHIATPILASIVGCGDTTSQQRSDSFAPPPTTSPNAQTTITTPPPKQPTATPIPKDITYTIIDKNIVPRIKRSLDIRLNRKVSEDVLSAIAMQLKNSDPNTYERTFIGYYLPDMTVNAGYWATTHFDPILEVRILGLTAEREKTLGQLADDPSREAIGSWLHDEDWFAGRITIFRQDGGLHMEKTYGDGSSGKEQIVERPSSKGRKFMNAKRTGPDNDYYLIDNNGNLQIWSKDVDDTHVLVSTAKKIN